MAVYRTTDYDEIRKWVEEHNGEPAVIRGVGGEEGEGILTIAFGQTGANVQIISWTEFFSTFDEMGLRFRYEAPVPMDEAEWDFGFEGRDEPLDSSEEDETELPEDIEDVDENLFPSAPADEDGRVL